MSRCGSLLRTIALTGFLLVLAACVPIAPASLPTQTAAQSEANPIIGVAWQWTTLIYQPTGATTTIVDPQSYTLLLNADGTLSGKADCNSFSGTYTQESGLVITLATTTALDCGATSLDEQYLQLLGVIVAGGPDGAGGLALETAGGEQRMLFAVGAPASQ